MDLIRKLNPPFRAEHIGSFVRPDNLLNAARQLKAGKITPDELKRIADEAIIEIVRFQEDIGMPSVTDGEFRRRSWSAGFIDAVEGFGLREGTIEFRTQAAGKRCGSSRPMQSRACSGPVGSQPKSSPSSSRSFAKARRRRRSLRRMSCITFSDRARWTISVYPDIEMLFR